jgi:hypothetical protein
MLGEHTYCFLKKVQVRDERDINLFAHNNVSL